MTNDDLTKMNSYPPMSSDPSAAAEGVDTDSTKTVDNRDRPDEVAVKARPDGSDGATTGFVDDAGTSPVALAGESPRPSGPRSRAEQRVRQEVELAAAKERVRLRKARDQAMITRLVERGKERDAADRRRERREHEKQGNVARYRFADVLLQRLAQLEQGQWPPLIRETIAKASAEDRAAIGRIVERIRTKRST